MEMKEILELAEETGFEHSGELDTAVLEFREAVRDMCRADKCRAYGRNWSCPPGCGTLEEISARAAAYHRGVLLQSTGRMEDDFDVETMMDTERVHRERFYRLVEKIRKAYPDCLPMASGSCTQCEKCTYPDAPCRFPGRMIPSMESYGLVVSDVCAGSGQKYYYGPRTITYTACILID